MDRGLELLLDLDGTVLVQTDAGHWVRIRAARVNENPARPNGISYALTFHGPDNRRILGYDNAHGTSRRGIPFDHRHRSEHDEGMPYNFQSAEQLLSDFFADVDRWLKRND